MWTPGDNRNASRRLSFDHGYAEAFADGRQRKDPGRLHQSEILAIVNLPGKADIRAEGKRRRQTLETLSFRSVANDVAAEPWKLTPECVERVQKNVDSLVLDQPAHKHDIDRFAGGRDAFDRVQRDAVANDACTGTTTPRGQPLGREL
jgi:hypothetical protein